MADDGPATLEADRPLLDAYRRGERAAFAKIFELYVDDVARTLRAGVRVRVEGDIIRLGKDLPEQEIEALLQETFLKAFGDTARSSYDGLRPFGAYLATIARNLVIDRGRTEQKAARLEAHGVELDHLPGDGAEDAEWRQETAELRVVLDGFRQTLTPEEREIFRLRYEEELSHKQTGDALGMTAVQVRRRDSRIRQALLDYLRARGFLENARVRIGTSLLGRREGAGAETAGAGASEEQTRGHAAPRPASEGSG